MSWGWKDDDDRALEFPDEKTPEVAPAQTPTTEGRGRLIYQNDSRMWRASANGQPYQPFGAGAVGANTVTAWWIDPVNGDDQNSGQSAANALQTHEELRARLARQIIDVEVTVTLLDDFDRDNPIICDFVFGANGGMRYVGSKTLTTLATGTFTSVTAIARATNGATIVEDTGLAGDWGALGLVNADTSEMRRIRLTSGANVGAVAYACADLGSKTARTSVFGFIEKNLTGSSDPNFRALNGPPGALAADYGAPAVGDGYVVESGFVQVEVFNISPTFAGNFDGFPGDITVLVNDIDMVPQFGLSLIVDAIRNRTAAPPVNFSGCALGNCAMFAGLMGVDFCRVGGIVIDLRGGIAEFGACVLLGDVNQRPGSECLLFVDTLSQNSDFEVEGKLVFSPGALFDDDANAITILPGGIVITDDFFGLGVSAIYGDGNTGFGMEIKSGGQFIYDPVGATPAASNITITGTAGDFEIAGGGATGWAAPAPDLTDTAKLAGVSANT